MIPAPGMAGLRWPWRRRPVESPDPTVSELQAAARLLGLELELKVVPDWVVEARARCPPTTDPGYAPVGPCCLLDDGSECSMAGIASGCVFDGVCRDER